MKAARKIGINLGTAKAKIELLEDEAPLSCDLIWSRLPLRGRPFHTFESGREIFLQIPDPEPNIIPENQTTHQVPGDVFIYYKPALYIEPDWPEIKHHSSVIGFSYGRDTQIKGTYMPLPVNIIGKIIDGLEELEEEAARLKNEGIDEILFTIAT